MNDEGVIEIQRDDSKRFDFNYYNWLCAGVLD